MTYRECREIGIKVMKFLDLIDLLSEMKDGRENLREFMYRLEEKYPFKYLEAVSLFDAFNESDFDYYLTKRYDYNECYTDEIIYTDIVKR